MVVSLIVAMNNTGVIGKNNKIPWYSKEDLQYFKETTLGKPIIMGRKTWDSLKIKPLPGRFNIVLTKNESLIGLMCTKNEGPFYIHSLPDAIQFLEKNGYEEVFIIGGSSIYDEAITANIVDQMYINIMKNKDDVKGDAFFPYVEKTHWIIEKSQTRFTDFDAYLFVKKEQEEIN